MSSVLDDLLDPETARAIIDNPPANHRVVEALEGFYVYVIIWSFVFCSFEVVYELHSLNSSGD